jgi:hypothetical protein
MEGLSDVGCLHPPIVADSARHRGGLQSPHSSAYPADVR